MTTKTLYVTVNEGDPCQVVGSHPLRYARGDYPNVFLLAIESVEQLAYALMETFDEADLSEAFAMLIGWGAAHEKQG